MLIFYVDESGHHTLAPSRVEAAMSMELADLFILTGVGVRDLARKPLATELQRIKQAHFGTVASTADWSATELKGRYLSAANHRFQPAGDKRELPSGYDVFTKLDQVMALERDLRLVFARFRPVIFTIVIDKGALLRRHPETSALDSAYSFLYRRVALTLQKTFVGEGGVFVADQQAEHERHFTSGGFAAFRDNLNENANRRAEYELILDKPLWIDTKLSSWDRELIQLADLAAYATMEQVTGRTRGGVDSLWAEIYRCLAVGPKSGEVEREGIVIYPEPNGWPDTRPDIWF